MSELLISKVAQAVLFFLGWGAFVVAQAPYIDSVSLFEEAAKYGFAVLFLLIVLFLIYKDYKAEKTYSREETQRLNKLIAQMVDDNRKAVDNSTHAINSSTNAMERQTLINQELTSAVKVLTVKLESVKNGQ